MPDVRYGQHVNLQLNELRNAKLHLVNGLPTPNAGNAGWIVYNTADNRVYYSNGSAFVLRATEADALNDAGTLRTAAYLMARANHTGQQTASTISDFNTAVRTNRLDQMAAPTGPVGMGGQKITGGANGTATTDFATYGQLLALAQQQDFKDSVRFAGTANVAINGLNAVDVVVPSVGDRVLLTGQTDATQNGMWVVAAGAWTRPVDADTAGEVSGGTIVPVEEGTNNADTLWMCTNNGPVNPGVTAQTWIKYGASQGEIITAGLGLTKTGSTLDIGAGNGILVTADAIAIDPTVTLRRAVGAVPAGSTSAVITHPLNTLDVMASVTEVSTGDKVFCGVTATDVNNVTLSFATAPTTNQYRYQIFG